MAPSSVIMGRTYILKTSLGSRASDCPGLILGSSALTCLRELPKFSPCVLPLGVHTLVHSAYSVRTCWQPIGYHRNDTAAFLWTCGFENASFYLAFSCTTCSEENQLPCHEPYGEIEVSCNKTFICQPCEWTDMEADPSATIQPSDAYSPWCNLKIDLEPELLSWAIFQFLIQRNLCCRGILSFLSCAWSLSLCSGFL